MLLHTLFHLIMIIQTLFLTEYALANKIMIYFQRMNAKVTTCVLIICLNQASALAIPKWSDIFSSLQPYKDPETLMLEEEEGEPRVGFVQVSLAVLPTL